MDAFVEKEVGVLAVSVDYLDGIRKGFGELDAAPGVLVHELHLYALAHQRGGEHRGNRAAAEDEDAADGDVVLAEIAI